MQGQLKDFHDFEPEQEDFLSAVQSGLSNAQKSLASKFFYDEKGSQLFDQICDLEEYYPTRTELGILKSNRGEIAEYLGTHSHLIEFGSGSSTKIRILLDAMNRPLSYVPMDISRDHLLIAAKRLAGSFPDLPVVAICADYTADFPFPNLGDGKRTGFFPGSTIGNFTPEDAVAFLSRAKSLLKGGGMLIGVDLLKEETILHAAYNDQKKLTAAFNLNLLDRCNAELSANFDVDQFAHAAHLNTEKGRIEMHLVSKRDQIVSIGGTRFGFREGETIHTENSYKYTISGFQELARRAGFSPQKVWTDEQALFSVHYLAA
ncbi:MAG: L-histidine N(alpha)-methyltransferase [Sneathiella sp.]